MAPASGGTITFYAAQDRHRRSAQLLSVVCVFLVAVLAAAAAVAVSPFAIVLFAAGARLVDLAISLPAAVWTGLRILLVEFTRIEAAIRAWPIVPVALPPLLAAAGRLIVPGFVAIVLLWFVLWRVMVGAAPSLPPAIPSLRPADPADPEEQQLEHLADGLAIAAGIARPRLQIADAHTANGGVFGLRPQDARIVVSRGLLQTLDRSETEAVLAHLYAHVADGDLGLHLLILSIANTFAVLTALLDAPLSATARRTLWQVMRATLRRGAGIASAADDATMAALLSGRVELGGISETGGLLDEAKTPGGLLPGVVRFVQFLVLSPLFLAGLVTRALLAPLVLLVVGPMLTGTLRVRRLLADAVAIQLSRDPDSLAQALLKLEEANRAARPTGGMELGWIVHGSSRLRADFPLWFVGSYPPLAARLRSLRRLGATVDIASPPADSTEARRAVPPAVDERRSTNLLVAIPLLLLTLALVAVVLIAGLQFFLYMIGVVLFAAGLLVGGLYVLAFFLLRLLLP